MEAKRLKKLTVIVNGYIVFGMVLIFAALLLVASPLALPIIYIVNPGSVENEFTSLTQDVVDEGDEDLLALEVEKEPEPEEKGPVLPEKDESLPIDDMLIIPKIGINTMVIKEANPDIALNEGPWLVPDFGTPEENIYPIIIASHRYGAVGWDSEERATKSFLELPNLQQGDRIEIVWDQRKYEYEVYYSEENTYISDYEADLILYTCKLIWDSPIRIFKYAKLVETNQI